MRGLHNKPKSRPAKNAPPKVSVKVGWCSIYFNGIDLELKCPACGEMVQHGVRHQCEGGKPVIEVAK